MRLFILKSQKVRTVLYFFPVQLLILLFKRNHVLLVFWTLVFGLITKSIAPRYGIPYLFLNPEYFDKVDALSYFIVGFATGGFIMAFNISSYIINGFHFPFLGTLKNPFMKYCLNNSIIPLLFLITYLYQIYTFQRSDQFVEKSQVFFDLAGFLGGLLLFLFLSLSYFFTTNKDVYKMFGIETEQVLDPSFKALNKAFLARKKKWDAMNYKIEKDIHVQLYLSNFFKLKKVQDIDSYEKRTLLRVLKQNHKNAATFELVAIVSLLTIGFFRDVDFFNIPAGASLMLLFTMYLMVNSALYNWFRAWSTTVFVLLIITINFLYQFDFFKNRNKAYNMNYNAPEAEFSNAKIRSYDTLSTQKKQDIAFTIEVLNNWRIKNSANSRKLKRKPKLILVNTSGGGLRSTLWTFYSLQYADSMLHGELLRHTQLITGASGGIIGAAYLRELMLMNKKQQLKNIHHPQLRNNISKDLLNPIALSMAVNDWFFPLQSVTEGRYKYGRDRAFAFERKLNENTNYILAKKLHDYYLPEKNAEIPMMVLSPTIINDGRKLIISPLPVSYLTQSRKSSNIAVSNVPPAIEFSRYFQQQEASNVLFTSALRMSATFPYILPTVSLPSKPAMEVMDAGVRDNFGKETSIQFLYTFHKWIEENTSGVIILQIRDRDKNFTVEPNPPKTIIQSIEEPVGSLYGNLFHVQDFNQSDLLNYAGSWYNGKIDVIDFVLYNQYWDNISLSWHLTNKEKRKVFSSVNTPANQLAFKKLKLLLE
ncbi:MAG: patatin-like phospholipase family protein [Bacteroidetes bacterium]|nr:patatin-like phospholipase family protein [Bacteroidota bacterium]